jgi:hypothetical protein
MNAFDHSGYIKARVQDGNPLTFQHARSALEENIRMIDPAKHTVLWNITIALLYVCQAAERDNKDMTLVLNRLDLLTTEVASLRQRRPR